MTAVGVTVPGPSGELRAALSLAVPRVRFRRDLLPGWAEALSEAAGAVGRAMACQ